MPREEGVFGELAAVLEISLFGHAIVSSENGWQGLDKICGDHVEPLLPANDITRRTVNVGSRYSRCKCFDALSEEGAYYSR